MEWKIKIKETMDERKIILKNDCCYKKNDDETKYLYRKKKIAAKMVV